MFYRISISEGPNGTIVCQCRNAASKGAAREGLARIQIRWGWERSNIRTIIAEPCPNPEHTWDCFKTVEEGATA